MKNSFICILLLVCTLLNSCITDDYSGNPITKPTTISNLQFIGEQIIPDGQTFKGSTIGGLSSIDYYNGTYYIISDDPNAPIRFYTAHLTFDNTSFSKVEITNQVELLNDNGASFADQEVDPEAIRFDPRSRSIIWTSEGFANNNIAPSVKEASLRGKFRSEFMTPDIFKENTADSGVRNNGVFEGLSLSVDHKGYWVAMELPLLQDGDAPVFGMDTDSPVRISFIDRKTKEFGRQFAYELDPVARDGGFKVNGVVEILQYNKDRFLVLERSFASGTDDGGNDVRIYDVDASEATDISNMSSLKNANYKKATKTLLFDFNSIRDQLSTVPGGSANVVDNIEGMTFGPDLPNGNKSLVLVSDNNFSAFGAQLNQFIALEVLP
ncbi:esterase-like activity of phytase family protein [Aquimarina algicola]|nr:esterase-like activity of phytase family protein [Aquimarina algicola]